MNVRVKICGITHAGDALLAETCGAHAVGFIFYAPSPRAVTPEDAAAIAAQLHSYTLRVGVFVGESPRRINEIADLCRLDRIQLHGGEPHEMLARLNRPGYRTLKLQTQEDVARVRSQPDGTVMLDTHAEQIHGGTGRAFNWEWARQVGRDHPVILAGGLAPDNIAEAIRMARPMAVDASSSLEAAPGRKDPAKLEAFFRAIAQANAQTGTESQPGSATHASV